MKTLSQGLVEIISSSSLTGESKELLGTTKEEAMAVKIFIKRSFNISKEDQAGRNLNFAGTAAMIQFRPDKNNRTVAVLITTPMAATIINYPAASNGVSNEMISPIGITL